VTLGCAIAVMVLQYGHESRGGVFHKQQSRELGRIRPEFGREWSAPKAPGAGATAFKCNRPPPPELGLVLLSHLVAVPRRSGDADYGRDGNLRQELRTLGLTYVAATGAGRRRGGSSGSMTFGKGNMREPRGGTQS